MNIFRGGRPTIYVSGLNRAVAFYTKVLGMSLSFRAGDHYAQIDAGDGMMLGLHPSGSTSPKPGMAGGITVTFGVVGQLEEVVRTLKASGVRFQTPIQSDGPVRLVCFEDQDGNAMWLCEQASGNS